MILVSIFLLSNPGSKPQFVDKSRQKNVTCLEGHGKLIIYTILFPFFLTHQISSMKSSLWENFTHQDVTYY